MKLNILSDLHLGQGSLALPCNDADLVILAGDIARPHEAVAWATRLAKPVLYVPGNHEFYGSSLAGTIAQLRELCEGTRIRVLDNDEAVIDGVRFLGSTLWTDFMAMGDGDARAEAMRDGQRFMRDFSRIRIGASGGDGDTAAADERLFTPADSATLFARNARWLAAALARPHPGPTVVVTHHAPSRKSIHPRFAGSTLNACFVSDAEHLVGGAGTQLWIHGHTHDSFDYAVNGVRVLCNPRGYARDGVNENPRFDPELEVEVVRTA